MRNIFTALLFFISISLFSQHKKRLALVIGNANYDKGELKNPVNDARLIASTLDSLDFDVILKENLENRTDFIRSIREFGNKRSDYDVAFVYYAGHGIQVDDENFLLPTKEEFSSEEDVLDFGVSVQNIMRYLRAQTNEVNILILDACRDNPFESNWNTTRSLKGGGLAKIPAPTGSLIAFSTDSGQTAPDGDGNNSTYTISLAKNMLLEDTSIDQVFRNVRSEVLAQTDGIQRPVEATQLTGQTFYLSPSKFEDEFIEIDKILIQNRNLNKALEFSNIILSKDPENYKALKKKAQTLKLMGEVNESNELYEELIKLNPTDFSNYTFLIVHKNYDISEVGLLDTNNKSFERLKTTIKEIDINKYPWLLAKLIDFKNNNESLESMDFNSEELLKISKNQQVIEQSVDDFRDYMLVPDDMIIGEYIFNDLIFTSEVAYYWAKDRYNDNFVSIIESYMSSRQEDDMSLLARSHYWMREPYKGAKKFEDYIKLSEVLLDTKNERASISINEELFRLYMFDINEYENGPKYLYDAVDVLENGSIEDGINKVSIATRIYNSLANDLFWFSEDHIGTLNMTDNFFKKYNIENLPNEYLDFNTFLLYNKNYITNLFLNRHEEALRSYKTMKYISENIEEVKIFKEQKYIMFKNEVDKNYISKLDFEIEENSDVFRTDNGNIVFTLPIWGDNNESPDSENLYSKLLIGFLIDSTNSKNQIDNLSEKFNINSKYIRYFIWNEFYGNKAYYSENKKYIDDSLIEK